MRNVPAAQLDTAIKVIAARDPARAQDIVAFIGGISDTVRQGVQAAQYQQQQQVAQAQRQYANYRTQWQQWADQQDKSYEALALSVPEQERHAIEREAKKMLHEAGWNDEQIGLEWNTSQSLRSFFGQKMLWDAARGRLNAGRAHAKRVKSAPHVQRPGSPLEFVPEADYQLAKLERRGQPLTAKQAADLVTARRQARKR